MVKKSLEQEAKEYRSKRTPPAKPKPLTSRRYLAGMIACGLLARSQGFINKADLKREAFELADYLLEE